MADSDLRLVERQEAGLTFERFDEDVAFELGARLRQRAGELNKSVSIGVELWDRKLFWATMPGLTSDNESWIARKIYLVRRFHQSSYRMALRYKHGADFNFEHRGIGRDDAVFAGGAFPIVVDGVGCVGAVAASGLPDREDHNLVVEAICAETGRDAKDWVLP